MRRFLADLISGMTEVQTIALFQRLNRIVLGSALDTNLVWRVWMTVRDDIKNSLSAFPVDSSPFLRLPAAASLLHVLALPCAVRTQRPRRHAQVAEFRTLAAVDLSWWAQPGSGSGGGTGQRRDALRL